MQSNSSLRIPLLFLWAALLTAMTTLLGAAPLKALHNKLGTVAYWLVVSAASLLLWGVNMSWAVAAFATISLLVGVYSEFEKRGSTVAQAGSFAVTSTGLTIAGIFYVWALTVGKTWRMEVLAVIEKILADAQVLGLTAAEALKAEAIALQLPSLLIVVLGLAVFLALLMEKPFHRWLGVSYKRKEKLSHFRVADSVIWPTIFALLAAFGQFDSRWVGVFGMNILNVCGLLYFFQGLAVLGKYFEVFRVGLFWRAIWIILLAVQLPMILGIIGLSDYWLDFRKFFHKKAAELQKKRVEE